MSNIQKSLFQKKLRNAELQLGLDFSEDADEIGEQPSKLTSTSKDTTTAKTIEYPTWRDFFDYNEIYETDSHFKFNTYFKAPSNSKGNPVIFICHHGAGSSGLTFGQLSRSLHNKFGEKNKHKVNPEERELPGIFTFDIRGHSQTALLNEKEKNFSMEQFASDFVYLLEEFCKRQQYKEHDINPSIFLVGHSLGGSVLTHVIFKNSIETPEILEAIKGLVMLDIVEEAATQSLHAMGSYLDKTPKSFKTIESCIQWHLESKLVNNEESANLSVPSLFQFDDSENCYKWIANLYDTRPYWGEWFLGLSSNFISIKSNIAKLLILSGHDNLDKYLMIGQMQGKYQLVVFQNQVYIPELGKTQYCGHFVHEDCPDKVALTLIDYVERNDFSRNDKPINIKWGSMR